MTETEKYEEIFNAVLALPDLDSSPVKIPPEAYKTEEEHKIPLAKKRKLLNDVPQKKETARDRLLQWNNFLGNTNYGIWIRCVFCEKWRKVIEYQEEHEVPEDWHCAMNKSGINSCNEPEESMDCVEFSPVKFIPGSVVWARLDGYPWWPAMVEIDPDTEEYFWRGQNALFYSVTFLDEKVTRAWIPSLYVRSFNSKLQSTLAGKFKDRKWKNLLDTAKKRANAALSMSIKDRLEMFSFATNFKGKWGTALNFDKINDTATVLFEEVEDLGSMSSDIDENVEEKLPKPKRMHLLERKEKKIEKTIEIIKSRTPAVIHIDSELSETIAEKVRKPLKQFVSSVSDYNTNNVKNKVETLNKNHIRKNFHNINNLKNELTKEVTSKQQDAKVESKKSIHSNFTTRVKKDSENGFISIQKENSTQSRTPKKKSKLKKKVNIKHNNEEVTERNENRKSKEKKSKQACNFKCKGTIKNESKTTNNSALTNSNCNNEILEKNEIFKDQNKNKHSTLHDNLIQNEGNETKTFNKHKMKIKANLFDTNTKNAEDNNEGKSNNKNGNTSKLSKNNGKSDVTNFEITGKHKVFKTEKNTTSTNPNKGVSIKMQQYKFSPPKKQNPLFYPVKKTEENADNIANHLNKQILNKTSESQKSKEKTERKETQKDIRNEELDRDNDISKMQNCSEILNGNEENAIENHSDSKICKTKKEMLFSLSPPKKESSDDSDPFED